MTRPPTRRQYLGAAAISGLAGVAGCSDLLEDIDADDEEPVGDETNESRDEGEPEEIDHEDVEGSVEFVHPSDGDEVTSPLSVELAVENFEVTPAGDDPQQGAGHLHVIVDEGCVEPGELIEFEEGYQHMSDGELETQLQMEPGEYDLCAQAGDDEHYAYAITDEITIEVTEDASQEGADGNPPEEQNQSESDEDENPINVNETDDE